MKNPTRSLALQRQPASMTEYDMMRATRRAAHFVADTLRKAEYLSADTRKDRRLEAHFCQGCFYMDRIGGAAMTSQPCMCCGKDQIYGSTNTDVLCLECAKAHSLCKHCGGDLDMNPDRRAWPTPHA